MSDSRPSRAAARPIDATNLISPDELERMLAEPAPRPAGTLDPSLAAVVAPDFGVRRSTVALLIDPVRDALAVEPVGVFLPRIDWSGAREAFSLPDPVVTGTDGSLVAIAPGEPDRGAATEAASGVVRVGDFFDAMRWDGSGGAADPRAPASAPAAPPPPPERRTATIEDVFDDFVW